MTVMENKRYLSPSAYNSLQKCSAAQVAKDLGEWNPPPTNQMLIGSYVDAFFSGTLNDFKKNTPQIFKALIAKLESLADFSAGGVEQACRALIKDLNISSGALIHPVRAAISGRTVTPGLFEVIAILGKEKTISRLNSACGIIG